MWWCNIWENGMDIMVSRGKDNTIETEWDVRRSIAKYLQHCLNIGFRHLRVNNTYICLSRCDSVTLWGKGSAGYLCCSIPCVSALVVYHSTPLHSSPVSLTRLLLTLKRTAWGQADHWGWPWLTWRQPPAETRASDLRQTQSVLSDSGGGRSQ